MKEKIFGSVVTKDVPANTIVAGNPAKILKKIFDEVKLRVRYCNGK